ncbi:MAG: D-tyrosyl-tRNA(Tyr) deacylase [Planctomycetota bacterium]|jgi:D-tyrosyl-tRNA(Tyr) deacylase
MKVVLQRVARASVEVDQEIVGAIDEGLLLLVGIGTEDDEAKLTWMADKICGLRIFRDDAGLMNKSVLDVGGSILAVSQFTLYGDTRKGRRPSFIMAAPPGQAKPLFDGFVDLLRERVGCVETGTFGAMMNVELINDGPVTLIVER